MSKSVGLGCHRRDDESWRDCALRYAHKWGLEREVMEMYDDSKASGAKDEDACWHALYEWDLLDLMP